MFSDHKPGLLLYVKMEHFKTYYQVTYLAYAKEIKLFHWILRNDNKNK